MLAVIGSPQRVVPNLLGYPSSAVNVTQHVGLFEVLPLVMNVAVVNYTMSIVVHLGQHF